MSLVFGEQGTGIREQGSGNREQRLEIRFSVAFGEIAK